MEHLYPELINLTTSAEKHQIPIASTDYLLQFVGFFEVCQ